MTRNQKHETRNPKPETRNPKLKKRYSPIFFSSLKHISLFLLVVKFQFIITELHIVLEICKTLQTHGYLIQLA
jgi:hypothetical protein